MFPSLTDTFGIVLLEALASGLPVAAFPVTGPLDVVASRAAACSNGICGRAVLGALQVPKERCRAYGETFTWTESARQFFGNIDFAHGHSASRTACLEPSCRRRSASNMRQEAPWSLSLALA